MNIRSYQIHITRLYIAFMLQIEWLRIFIYDSNSKFARFQLTVYETINRQATVVLWIALYATTSAAHHHRHKVVVERVLLNNCVELKDFLVHNSQFFNYVFAYSKAFRLPLLFHSLVCFHISAEYIFMFVTPRRRSRWGLSCHTRLLSRACPCHCLAGRWRWPPAKSAMSAWRARCLPHP